MSGKQTKQHLKDRRRTKPSRATKPDQQKRDAANAEQRFLDGLKKEASSYGRAISAFAIGAGLAEALSRIPITEATNDEKETKTQAEILEHRTICAGGHGEHPIIFEVGNCPEDIRSALKDIEGFHKQDCSELPTPSETELKKIDREKCKSVANYIGLTSKDWLTGVKVFTPDGELTDDMQNLIDSACRSSTAGADFGLSLLLVGMVMGILIGAVKTYKKCGRDECCSCGRTYTPV